jgi:hypothetical protein
MANPNGTLYHYTSRNGFLEIVKNHKLWATNILYLNDSEEFQYVFNLLKEILPSCDNRRIGNRKSFIEKVHIGINKINRLIDKWPKYVVSFSEKPDLLSQWRGYCGSGSGICIGFNRKHLLRVDKAIGISLRQCEYRKTVQTKTIKTLLNNYFSKINEAGVEEDDIRMHVASFFRELFDESPFFKHPSFREEKEWRLVVSEEDSSKKYISSVKYRDGISMILPYVEVDFKIDSSDIEFDEIIVGPSPHKDLSKASVRSFLEQTDNVKFAKVVNSAIPYRSW